MGYAAVAVKTKFSPVKGNVLNQGSVTADTVCLDDFFTHSCGANYFRGSHGVGDYIFDSRIGFVAKQFYHIIVRQMAVFTINLGSPVNIMERGLVHGFHDVA